jgi:hypothetical protein
MVCQKPVNIAGGAKRSERRRVIRPTERIERRTFEETQSE